MSRAPSPSWIANPSFRAHLIWVVAGSAAALLVVSSAAVLVPLLLRFEEGGASPDELARAADRILAMHQALWPMVVICLVSVIITSWLMYQRMVSPLVRFVKVFDAAREGRIAGPIQLRAADYLTREAESLNAMLAALRGRHADLVAARARVRDQIEELAEWASLQGDAEASRLVAELQDREKALSDQVARVVTE